MVERTLKAMRRGGIYDHVGFGFHRYSTDQSWLVPHFEKMLYDQALLALAYLEAFQATGNAEYADTAREIFTYVLRDMTDPEGPFYSAEDADSEGVEGRFYVWSEREIRHVLDAGLADLVIRCFHVRPDGNWVDATGHGDAGSNILHLEEEIADLAAETGVTPESLRAELERARQLLFAAREKRVHPHKDDKVLTDWNGLMIAALARGSQVLGEPRYARSGEEGRSSSSRTGWPERTDGFSIATGMEKHRYRQTWTITPSWSGGSSSFTRPHSIPGSSPRPFRLNRDQLAHFWDEAAGGFFFTPDDGEELLLRQKDAYDGAVPSGNSVAMLNLLRLARMTGDADLENKATQLGRALSGKVAQFPAGFTQLLCALSFALGPSHEVVLAGVAGVRGAAGACLRPSGPASYRKRWSFSGARAQPRKDRPSRSWPLSCSRTGRGRQRPSPTSAPITPAPCPHPARTGCSSFWARPAADEEGLLLWRTGYRPGKVRDHVAVIVFDYIPVCIGFGCVALVRRHCCLRRCLLVGARGLRGWDLDDVRRRGIRVLIVGIVIGRIYRYGVVRPPERAQDAPNNYSAQKSPEYGPSRRMPPVIVAAVMSSGGVASIIVASISMASTRVSGIPLPSAASGMTGPEAMKSPGSMSPAEVPAAASAMPAASVTSASVTSAPCIRGVWSSDNGHNHTKRHDQQELFHFVTYNDNITQKRGRA